MTRTVRDSKLDSRAARARLDHGGPYYRALDPGLHLGYRKGKSGGKWVVRWRGDDGYKVETIATADDTADADGVAVLGFAQAQELARARRVAHERAARGLPGKEAGPYTIRVCVDEYLSWLEENRKSARDARFRAAALIFPTLGSVVAAELTTDQLRKWHEAAGSSAARRRTRDGEEQKYRIEDGFDHEQHRKRRASANRVLGILRAALNRAWRDGKIASDGAWRRVEPFGEANAARIRYLTIDECRRLINATNGAFRDLVEAALVTGCRYGEMAALQCRDFNPDSGTLHIRQSKSGHDRHVVLADEGVALATRLTAGRPGVELMLRKADGNRWGASNQFRHMNEACERGKIEPAANFHSLRHTYASHSVMNGAPLLVVAKNLGHNDTRMVEKHYGHLSQGYIADAIRAAAPRFGIGGGNVTPLASGRGA